MSKLIATNEDNNSNGMMTKHEVDEDSEVRARMAKIKADLHINNIPTLCKSKDQMMRMSNDKRPRLVTLNHQASLNLRELSPSSTATFQRSLHTSNRKNILPNKLTLKSMTVDSSKDYSTSSSSSSDDSSCELNNSNPHQISSARSYTPNSTDLLSSSPMSAGLEAPVALPFSTSVTLHTHSTSSSARNRKQLCQSISVDEQPSNVIMMVAPLELAASAPKTMTTTTPCSTLNDDKINVTSAATNSSNANDDFAKVEAKVTSAVATTTTTASADDDVVTVVATTSIAAAVTMIPMTSKPGVDEFHLMPDLSMFDLINQTSRQFVLKPATPGLQIKCQIYRQKGIIYPEYKFYLENLDSNLLLLMSARKKKKSKTTCYVISSITFDLNDLEKYVENPLAKLKSNLLGTNFSLYDFGAKPSSNLTTNNNKSHLNSTTTITNNSSITTTNNNTIAITTTTTTNNNNSSSQQQLNMTNSPSQTSLPKSESSTTTTRKSSSIDTNVSDDTLAYRKEYLSVGYEMNVLGVKGPRQMSVILPGMDAKLNREDFIQHTSGETLTHAWKRIHSTMRSSPLASSPIGAVTGLATVTETSPSKTLNGLGGVGMSNKSSSSLGSAASTSKLSSIKRSLFQLSRTQSVEKSSSNKEASIKEEFNNLVRSSSENGSKTAINSTANKTELRNVVKLVNKPPSWHKELNSFALDFHGRVTMASVKNFQIAHEASTEYVVMQFGKCDKDLYTCDYSYPFCALQAFALALTSLDNKLGCD